MSELTLSFVDYLVLLTFGIVLIILVTEKIDKTALALIGATAIAVILYIFPQENFHTHDLIETESLIASIPWDTVMFITFMMLVVTASSRSGLFQWLAIKTIQISKGKTKTLYFSFIILTFFISFFFDTVTSMLILAPLTIEIMKVLERDFRPYLISEAIVANFGSIPSLIGSVPNIVIGNQAELTFIQLLFVLGPLAIILLISSLPVFFFFHKDILNEQQEMGDIDMRIFVIDAALVIKQPKLFIISIVGIIILLLGFTIGQLYGMSPVLTAMIAMAFLLIASKDQIAEILREVQWGTIYFIIGLLVMVQAIEELGIIEFATKLLEPIIINSPEIGGLLMIWVGGILSGLVDNIPISAALAPIATSLGGSGSILAVTLIFGVNIGGYLTPIASPANILALSYSEKEHTPISFTEFAKLGTTLSIIHLIIGSVYFVLFTPLFSGIIAI